MRGDLRSCLVLVWVIVFSAVGISDDGWKVVPDVVYGHKDGLAMTFDVFKPANPNGAGVLFMVSAGWVSRWSPPETLVPYCKPLLDRGFTVFAVRHGSSPRYKVPDAVEDVRRAVRYVRLRAKDLGVDANRLGVFGASAGGHLSLLLGTSSDDGNPEAKDEVSRAGNRIAAVVAYFPPVDLRGMTGPNRRFPALEFEPEKAEGVSPILFVTPDDAPTLLVHGDRDELVPLRNSERIHAEFLKHGVTSEFVVLPGAGHGFRGKDAERAAELMVQWFERHLNGGR